MSEAILTMPFSILMPYSIVDIQRRKAECDDGWGATVIHTNRKFGDQ
jgi:hypothetical protein